MSLSYKIIFFILNTIPNIFNEFHCFSIYDIYVRRVFNLLVYLRCFRLKSTILHGDTCNFQAGGMTLLPEVGPVIILGFCVHFAIQQRLGD